MGRSSINLHGQLTGSADSLPNEATGGFGLHPTSFFINLVPLDSSAADALGFNELIETDVHGGEADHFISVEEACRDQKDSPNTLVV